MALSHVLTVALVGVQGHLVDVEAHLGQGVPSYSLVGLPDTSLLESRERVRAAMVNSDQSWPSTRRVTVNLSPASLPKRGSGFDLAIAAAMLTAQGEVPVEALRATVLLGELGLDGRVRAVPGVLPAVAAAARAGVERAVVPAANAAEARLVPDIGVTAVGSLRELVAYARGELDPEAVVQLADDRCADAEPADQTLLDLADVLGQAGARFLLEVAAAGGPSMSRW